MAKKSCIDQINLTLIKVSPRTAAQRIVLDSDKQNLVLHGVAGTGKTFLAMYLAFRALEEWEQSRVLIIRSAVPTRSIGHLPGTEQEKLAVYQGPYIEIASELFNRADAYSYMVKKDIINFESTSYLRGTTKKDTVIIVDEPQNMSYHELDTIMTRMGHNSRIIFAGDYRQADLTNNGLAKFFKIIQAMESFHTIEFNIEDIVRSDLVKEYIVTKTRLENEGSTK